MKKVLITRKLPDDVTARIAGMAELVFPSNEAGVFSEEELIAGVESCDGLFAVGSKIGKEVIAAGKHLKAVGNMGAGYDNIDWKYATEKNIAVINTPFSVTHPTAELTIGIILDVMRGITGYGNELRKSLVTRTPLFTHNSTILYGKTLGIIGFGRIGKAVAQKAKGLGMKVIYHDVSRADVEVEASYGVAYYADRDSLLRESDVVTLHCQYFPENRHMISDAQFEIMKPTAYLINAARGPLVSEAALIKALEEHKIAGAALDTFEFEPKISEKLVALERLVIVPHIGAQAYDVRSDMVVEGVTGLVEFLEGKIPHNLVNREILK